MDMDMVLWLRALPQPTRKKSGRAAQGQPLRCRPLLWRQQKLAPGGHSCRPPYACLQLMPSIMKLMALIMKLMALIMKLMGLIS